MPFRTIKEIKLELKRLRKRQNMHQNDEKITHKKNQLRTQLWKLLKEQPRTKRPTAPQRKTETSEESEPSGKTKGSGRYI